ncbi:putative cinnamoyl-CoA reductase [Xylariomycetidae sp. FL2044]|nr:putative cinnamoyl-CoA reductase [Xylariomycetidae sp. FL2044]
MSSRTLLLTGGTGLIGFRVLLNALREGWTVRAAVRSASKADYLAKHPLVVDAVGTTNKLSFVEVPDICADNAYDEAIKGVTHIIHLASPIPSPELDLITGIYEPNVKSIMTMLESTIKSPSLQKLVFTTSAYANTPYPPDASFTITPDFRVPNMPGPFEDMVTAYWASKVASINALDSFVEKNKPSFDVVRIFPGWVFGTDDRALTLKDFRTGSNRVFLSVITGEEPPWHRPSGTVHIYDTAQLHILALEEGAPSNIGSTIPHVFNDAWDIVVKHFPKEVEEGILTKGSVPTTITPWDSSQTAAHFNFVFRTWEEIVVDTARQYLELLAKEPKP